MLTKLATDPKQTKAVRGAVVARLVEKRTPAAYIFDALAAVVWRGDDAHRLTAARGLAPIGGRRWPNLEELRALLKDEKVAEALARAVRESAKP